MSGCACGCGQALRPDKRGRPRSYIHGHNRRGAIPPNVAAAIAVVRRDPKAARAFADELKRDEQITRELHVLRKRYAAQPNGGPPLRVLGDGRIAGITTILGKCSDAISARIALSDAGWTRRDDGRFVAMRAEDSNG